MQLGFVILNYNSFADARRVTEALLNTNDPQILIVLIDNASPSPDAIGEWASLRLNERVVVIDNGQNGGYAKGNNIGIDVCLTRGINSVIVLNPDVHIAAPLRFIELLRNHFRAGDFLCLGLGVRGVRPYYSAVNLFSIALPLISRQVDRIQDGLLRLREASEKRRQVGRIYGCAIAIDARRFREADLFDAATFLYGEEVIVSLVARRQKLKLFVAMDIEIEHRALGSSGGKIAFRHLNWMRESTEYTLIRYFNLGPFLANMIARFSVLQITVSYRLAAWMKNRLKAKIC
jgi:GT2 family glycosyltransferase